MTWTKRESELTCWNYGIIGLGILFLAEPGSCWWNGLGNDGKQTYPEASSCYKRDCSHHWDVIGDQETNEWASHMGQSTPILGRLMALSNGGICPFQQKHMETDKKITTLLTVQLSGYKLPWLSFVTILINLLRSALQRPQHLSFLYYWLHLLSTGHISGDLPSALVRHSGTKQKTGSLLCYPTESVY